MGRNIDCFTEMAGRPVSRPQLARTHEENRLESCCTCGGKVKPRATRGKITPVTKETAEKIKKWAKPEFDQEVLSFPLGLCCSCRRQLSECEKTGAVSPGLKA